MKPRWPDGYDRSILDFLKDPKALSSKTVTEKALTAFLALIENPPAPTSPAQASAPGNEAEIAPTLASQLAQLASMHQAGQLTADEFERAKEKVLA